MAKVYALHNLDVIGSEDTGFEVNDVYPASWRGKLVSASEDDVLDYLERAGWGTHNPDEFFVEGEYGDILYIEYEGQPMVELRPV